MNDSPHSELRLDQFLKLSSATSSGGGAKFRIQNGEVKVNGEVETRRRRKLQPGDVVELDVDGIGVLRNVVGAKRPRPEGGLDLTAKPHATVSTQPTRTETP